MTELRPHLAFRVGVTGHRDKRVREGDERIIAAVDECLTLVRDELHRLAALPRARSAYAPPAPGWPLVDFRLVSSLAEGADRLFARRADGVGARVYAPLPFPRKDYIEDFTNTPIKDFEDLADNADVFALDGDHNGGEAQTESYEAVGRFTARNCDLLIALWDGKPSNGQGGTESTAEYAARIGLRVWWINAVDAKAPARFIRNLAEFRNPERAPQGEDAKAALQAYLRELILPPEANLPERDGALGEIGAALRIFVRPDQAPLDEFYQETSRPSRTLWRAYAAFMAVLAPDPGGYQPREPEGPDRWTDLYLFANHRSGDYGDRYRSSYVLVAFCVIVALATAAFGGEEDFVWQVWFIVAEIAALAGITLLVVVNYAWRWHERWISYRLLAELARKQRVLAQIGQSLPTADVAQLAADATEARGLPRDAWIAWLFMAHRRAAPPPIGAMDRELKEKALTAGLAMIEEQIKYHEDRLRRAVSADVWVKRITEFFFIGTIVLALAKFALILDGEVEASKKAIHALVFYAAAVSSIATAFVGVRAYAEFALLSRQSRHMVAVLKTVQDELTALGRDGLAGPGGSLHLGRTLYAATTAMMQDITGWAHLFRVKRLEAG